MFKKVGIIVTIALLFMGCSSGYKLQYKGTPNEIRQYELSTDLDQTMEMMGNEMNFATQIIQMISEKINRVEKDGAISASITIDSISFTSTSPQMRAVEDQINGMMANIKGKEITYKISSRGEVLESTRIDSLIPDQMRQVFSTRQTFSNLSPELPDHAVKMGDAWEIEKTTPISAGGFEMEMKSKNKYTLVGKEVQHGQTLLKIQFTGSVEFTGKGEQMGMQLLMEGDGETKGEFLFHDNRGLYQSGTSGI